jgi:hypothetical protein
MNFLPNCLSQSLCFRRRKTGEILCDLHVGLLVDAIMSDDIVRHKVMDAIYRDVIDAFVAGRLDGDDLLPDNASRASRRLKVEQVEERLDTAGFDTTARSRLRREVLSAESHSRGACAEREAARRHALNSNGNEFARGTLDLIESGCARYRQTRVDRPRRPETLSGDHEGLDQAREPGRTAGGYLMRCLCSLTSIRIGPRRDRRADSKPQKQRLHIMSHAARDRLEEAHASTNVSVAIPERGEEPRDFLFVKLENALRNELRVA